jgi:hypothetical protein
MPLHGREMQRSESDAAQDVVRKRTEMRPRYDGHAHEDREHSQREGDVPQPAQQIVLAVRWS